MNQLAAWAGSWASRSSSVLLAALVGMVAAVTAVIVVSVRGGLDHDRGRFAGAVRTGDEGHGWAGAGVASGRGGAGTRAAGPRWWWPVSRACVLECICVAVRDVVEAGRGRCGTGCRRALSPDRRPDPGGLPVPAEQESNDAITRSQRSGRQPGAAGGSRAPDDVSWPSTAGCGHMHRLTPSSRANDLKR